MKRIQIATASLLSLLCLSALATSNAFALTGAISKNVETPVEVTLRGITGESAKEGDFETVAGSKLPCTKWSFSGKINSLTSAEGTLTGTGCSIAGFKCKTSNTTVAGEIKISIVGTVRIKKSKLFLEFKLPAVTLTCGTISVPLKGSVLLPISPLGTLLKHYTFGFLGKAGKQEPDDEPVEAHLEMSVAGKAFEHASLQLEGLEITFEENVAFI